MNGTRVPFMECPECGGSEIHDIAADDAPHFILECRDCEHRWSMAGFAFVMDTEAEED